MLETDLKLTIRPYSAHLDKALILASIARHVRRLPPFKTFEQEDFNKQIKDIERKLEEDDTMCFVACDPEYYQQVFGFIIGGPPRILHFCYVRKPFRQCGIGTTLMTYLYQELGTIPIYTTLPMAAQRFYEDRWALKYNPYLWRV